MMIDDYLHGLGLERYDFEEIVRRLKGRNNIDDYGLEEIAPPPTDRKRPVNRYSPEGHDVNSC